VAMTINNNYNNCNYNNYNDNWNLHEIIKLQYNCKCTALKVCMCTHYKQAHSVL